MNIIIIPTACPDCPPGEFRGFMVHCRHYNRSAQTDHESRPEYCRVEKVTIAEEDNGD